MWSTKNPTEAQENLMLEEPQKDVCRSTYPGLSNCLELLVEDKGFAAEKETESSMDLSNDQVMAAYGTRMLH